MLVCSIRTMTRKGSKKNINDKGDDEKSAFCMRKIKAEAAPSRPPLLTYVL